MKSLTLKFWIFPKQLIVSIITIVSSLTLLADQPIGSLDDFSAVKASPNRVKVISGVKQLPKPVDKSEVIKPSVTVNITSPQKVLKPLASISNVPVIGLHPEKELPKKTAPVFLSRSILAKESSLPTGSPTAKSVSPLKKSIIKDRMAHEVASNDDLPSTKSNLSKPKVEDMIDPDAVASINVEDRKKETVEKSNEALIVQFCNFITDQLTSHSLVGYPTSIQKLTLSLNSQNIPVNEDDFIVFTSKEFIGDLFYNFTSRNFYIVPAIGQNPQLQAEHKGNEVYREAKRTKLIHLPKIHYAMATLAGIRPGDSYDSSKIGCDNHKWTINRYQTTDF